MNFDRIRELLEKVPVPLITLVVVAYFGYDYYSFMNHSDSPLFLKNSEFVAVQGENDKLRTRVLALTKFIRELESKKVELRQLASKLDEMKTTLSDSFDVPSFMRMAVTEAKKIGLTVVALRPQAAVDREYYSEQPFEFSFKGVYVQLLVFLHRMAQTQTIVRVDNFTLKPSGSRSTGYTRLEGVIQIKGYRYIRSKADELRDSNNKGGAK